MPRPVIVTEPSPEHLRAFLASWPPGIGRLQTTEGDVFGLLMRRGPDVVWCRAGMFDAVDDPFELADRAARAVLCAMADRRDETFGATAFMVGEEGAERVGIAVFTFDEATGDTPGAGGGERADGFARAVAQVLGVSLGEMAPRPYDTIGTYRLQGMATAQGLLFVGRVLPDDDDPVWQEWPSDAPIVHLPSVGFVEEASEDDA